MSDVRVFSGDPGLAALLANGSGFNIVLEAERRLEIPLGQGVLGLVGTVVNDRGQAQRPIELTGGIEDLRTRWGGFRTHLGDGPSTGYAGNLAARAAGASAPRVVLQPVDMACKDKSIADPTATDLKLTCVRGVRPCTFTDDGDLFVSQNHALQHGDIIEFISVDPGKGLAPHTSYHVATTPSADTFTLAATAEGSSLPLSGDGGGIFRPIAMANSTLGPKTVPAGVRICTANGAFVVRTLEDLTWGLGDLSAQSVRIAPVAGTEAPINTLTTPVSSDFGGLWEDLTPAGAPTGSTLALMTTTTAVPTALNAPERLLRYRAAFASLLDTPAGQTITVLACDRDEAGIADALAEHCAQACERGYFRMGVVAPPVGTTEAAARSDSGDGIKRTGLDRSNVSYVHGAIRRTFLEDAAHLSGISGYLATLPGAIAFAARIANTPPWENPARPHACLRAYGLLELEAVPGLLPARHFQAGIVVPEFVRDDGALAASFRDGILADGTKIAHHRLQAYLAEGLLANLAPYHKAPATPANREAAQDACAGFLEVLVTEGRIARYALAERWDPTNDHWRLDAVIDRTGNMDVITLGLLVGGDVVKEDAA